MKIKFKFQVKVAVTNNSDLNWTSRKSCGKFLWRISLKSKMHASRFSSGSRHSVVGAKKKGQRVSRQADLQKSYKSVTNIQFSLIIYIIVMCHLFSNLHYSWFVELVSFGLILSRRLFVKNHSVV